MTDDNIKEVINRTSIVDIINTTIPLKKKGNNYFGLSPFKNEKTPSFSVNEEKKIFHCFSTGEHGNVIDFLIKVKGYSFKDALNELANKAGIELNFKSSKINQTIYEINEFAKNLFHQNLLNTQKHLDYLKNNRKFNDEVIQEFKIGSSFNANEIEKQLTQKFEIRDLIAAGLFKNQNKSNLFFRNRIIVPIANLQNKVLGYGARVIDESLPKYINTPETKIFKKRNILFNERVLNKHENKKLILVEGYFDVIKLSQNKIINCIAPLGTAINADKLIEITKKGFDLVICLDGDSAGRNATLRLMNNLLSKDNFELGIKFVLMPKNFDPDQMLEVGEKEQFLKLVNKPLSIEKLIEKYLEKYSSSDDIDTKFQGTKILQKFLSNIANQDLKKIFVNHFEKVEKNSKSLKPKSTLSNINQFNAKSDLKTKFIAGVILFYVENPNYRDRVYDLVATANISNQFKEIRDLIIKKTNKNLNPEEIYSILDSKGLNFTKNLLFSNEVRRLCRFASPAFKDDPYNEIEKTINFINS